MDQSFLYQDNQSFLLGSPYYPNTPIELPQQPIELSNSSSYFPYYYSEVTPEFSATFETSSSLNNSRTFPAGEIQMAEPHDVSEQVPTPQASTEKKRKNSNRSSLSSPQTKEVKAGKNKKQRAPVGVLKEKEEKKFNTDKMDPPAGYIHVRARRGQATDSHSLAERVRRENIRERMQMLQGLVPGCEKVTGKALVLNEIINYVQSLKNQVEFLSMKLASLSPLMYNLCEGYGGCMNQQEKIRSKPHEAIPSVIQANHIQPTSYESAKNCPSMMGTSSSFLLQGQGGPTTFSRVYPSSEASSDQTRNHLPEIEHTHANFQDNESFLVQVDEQRQAFLNQLELDMYSSQ